MKRVLSIVMSLALAISCCCCFSVDALAAEGETIYTGFVGANSVDDFEVGSNYVFFMQTFGADEAVINLPDGGAELSVISKTSDTVYVNVVKRGNGFDNCSNGRIKYSTADSSWHYWCGGGAVNNLGPFYAYSYDTGSFTEDDVTAIISAEDVDKDTVKDYTRDEITVYVTVGGTTYAIPYYVLVDGSIDMPAGDDEITVSVGSINKVVKIKVKSEPAPVEAPKKEEPQKVEPVEENDPDIKLEVVSIDKTEVGAVENAEVPGSAFNISSSISNRNLANALKDVVINNNTKINAATGTTKAAPRTLEFYSGKPMAFNNAILRSLANSKVDVVYYFKYDGHLYSITIPAGTNPDLILGNEPFAGPLYVGKVLCTTRLIK